MRKVLLLCVAVLAFRVWGQTLDEYVVHQCILVGVSLDVALAILSEENPTFNFSAVHVNGNGTRDLGLWQLNEYWLERDFIPRYWVGEDRFQWDNPFHSTYVAVRHIRWLYGRGLNHWQVILAHNCGYGAISSNEVPNSSIEYANRAFARVAGVR